MSSTQYKSGIRIRSTGSLGSEWWL